MHEMADMSVSNYVMMLEENSHWMPGIVTGEEEQDTMHVTFERLGRAIADTGCTFACAGKEWLVRTERILNERGLEVKKTPHYEIFRGLGVAKRESLTLWTFPTGIKGVANTTVDYAEIDGNMTALLSRPVLTEWGFKADLMNEE